MNKKYHKVLSTLSLFSLLFNLFFPTLDAMRVSIQARAQETVAEVVSPTPQSEVSAPTPTSSSESEDSAGQAVEPTVEVTVAPTSEPTTAPTETITAEPTVIIEPTTATTPETTQTQEQQKPQDQQQTNTTETPAPTTEVIATPIPPTATPQLDEQISTTIVKLDGSYADPALVPVTWTDKADYAPTEKVVVSGKNFVPNSQYNIAISSTDPPAVTHNGTFTTTGEGTFTYEYQLDGNYRPNYKVEVKDGSGTVVASTTFTDSFAADIDQCRNGAPGAPVNCTGSAWVNGNAGKTNSHYREGDSVPYRIKFSDALTSGTNLVTIEWDTTKGGKHALDYLTSFNETETTADPCFGISGCGSPSTYAIPDDPNSTVTQKPGVFTLYNGTITSVSAYTLSGSYSGDSSTSITISFTASNSTPVLAWGGHIGSQIDWGSGNSAVNISGSPYHMRVGGQDRSLSADAILPTPNITTQASPSTLYVNQTVIDTATLVGSGTKPPAVTGNVDFYVCGPNISNPDCTSGGTKVGSTKTIISGSVTSDIFTPTVTGNYCFRAEYIPDSNAEYSPINHTNTTTECFSVTSPPVGTLTIIKNTIGADGSFDFIGTGVSNFTLTTSSNTASTTFSNLNPAGTYSVSETLPDGWTQNSAVCSNGTPSNIIIVSDQTTTCTFTNTRKTGKLELQKDFVGTPESVTLNIGATQNGNEVVSTAVSADGSTTEQVVATGTYYVSESLTNPSNYESALACYNDANDNDTIDNSETTHTVNTTTGAVAVSENNDIICRYTNTRNTGFIELKKKWTGTGGQTTLNIGTTVGDDDVDMQLTGANGTSPLTTGQNLVDTGTYYLSETGGLTNYTPALSCFNDVNNNGVYNEDTESPVSVGAGNAVSVATGQYVVCEFVNTRNTGKISIHKMVDTDGDGNFDVTSDSGANSLGFRWGHSTTPTSNTTEFGGEVVKETGAYDIYENNISGYHLVGWYLTGSTENDCENPLSTSLPANLTVSNGETISITICNARDTGTIQVVKDVTPNDSGVSSWDFAITGPTDNTATDINDGESSNAYTSETGDYSIEESGSALGDYTTTYVCMNGRTAVTSGTGTTATFTLTTGMNVVCTFTNSVKKGNIVVKKSMVGGTGSFTFTGDVAGTITTNNGTLTQEDVLPGTYTSTESAATGWELSSITCTDTDSTGNTTNRTATFTVQPGETVTCTFVNSKLPTLTVIKNVVNNNGGDANASDFTMTISQGVTSVASFAGDENGVTTTLVPGTYSVDEGANALYAKSMSGYCTDVVLAYGDAKTCTITNDDIKPQLHLRKVVTNDNGGTALATAWTLNASGPTGFSGTTPVDSDNSFDAGTYTLSETGGPAGYTASNWVCTGGGTQDGSSITLGLGDDVTCTITNDDNTARLIVIKNVVNDNGGTKVESDFTMGVTGTNVSDDSFPGDKNGTTVTLNAGTYSVGESGPSGYTANYSDNCSGTIALGESKTCTITNNDNAPSLTLVKVVENNHGGTAVATNWTLTATGPTTITGAGGATSGKTFSAGAYTLSETGGPTTYTSGSWNCTNNVSVNANNEITLGLGETTTCTVYNSDQPATLIVTKVVNNNYGGTLEADDFTLTTTGTNAAPTSFKGSATGTEITLDAGSYSVTEPTLPDGYKELSNTCSGTIAAGETKTCTVTNADTFGKVVVTKFNDVNGDGTQGEGENGMEDWEITLSDFTNQTTDENGVTEFTPVLPGSYVLGEVQQTGWKLTGISCDTVTTTPTPTPTTDPGLTPSPTQTPSTSKMNICHYNESSGRWNAQQIATSAWATHQTHGDEQNKDFEYGGPLAANGHPAPHTGEEWCRANNPLAATPTPTEIPDQLISLFGIKQAIAVDSEDEVSTTKRISVAEGQTVTCTIGNQFVEPDLLIEKSNNKELIDQSPGADVTYTLTVTADKNNVNGVTVIDLPPKGFTYRSGSWTAMSSVRGNLKPGVTTEPTYASPGTWQLGNMIAGEVVTLTYIADISNDQKPGTYRDLALAQGTSTQNAEVVANDDTGTFVGTNVTVVRNTQLDTTVNVKREEKREVVGEVLGASTLPATGSDNAWTFASVLLTVAGLLAFVLGFGMHKKRFGQIVGVLVTVVTAGMIAGTTYAITSTSIRLSQPKTPINQTFTLSFVALDLLDREVTVRCYKKGPSDGGYSQFGGDIALAAGGNSGECPINDALLSSNGTYSFYATATATGDSAVTSATVSVDFNEDAPSTPTSYSKSKVGSCEYKITFRTANDSDSRKTVKVEIYRNENTSFAVDGSNKVGEVAIGPNEEGSFTNTVPDCGKTYYYVIRAYNSFGNGSGVIGDSEVTIITTTTSTTTTTTTQGGAIPVENAGIAQGAEEEVTDQEEVEPAEEGAAVLGESEEAQKGGVLGAMQAAVKNNKYAWVYIIAIAVATLGLGYVVYKKTKEKSENL